NSTEKAADGTPIVDVQGSISLGMGGAGASGAKADPHGRVGVEDMDKPELWRTLGNKRAGQEAASISYGVDGANTAGVSEDATAQQARASELGLQVAAQRDESGVGTVGTKGPAGPIQFEPQEDGTYKVGLPVTMVNEKGELVKAIMRP